MKCFMNWFCVFFHPEFSLCYWPNHVFALTTWMCFNYLSDYLFIYSCFFAERNMFRRCDIFFLIAGIKILNSFVYGIRTTLCTRKIPQCQSISILKVVCMKYQIKCQIILCVVIHIYCLEIREWIVTKILIVDKCPTSDNISVFISFYPKHNNYSCYST